MTILHQLWMKKKNFMEWSLQIWWHSYNRKEKLCFQNARFGCSVQKRYEDLGGVLPEHVNSTRLKLKLLVRIDGLTELKRGKTSYLAFDDDLCDVFKTIYEKDFDKDAFVLSRAADILHKSLLKRESKKSDGEFHLNS